MKRRKTGRKKAADGIGYLLLLIIAVLFTLHFVGQRTEVRGVSMEPALSQGDQILIDKLSYRFREPDRFEIIVFHKNQSSFYYIKRVIALPGERIWISREGNIYINDRLLKEYYGKERISDPGLAGQEITLGGDEYFVLGDNRNSSEDSRSEEVGVVKRSEIIGRAAFRFYPLNAVGALQSQ